MSIDVSDSVTELALDATCPSAHCEAYWAEPATATQR